MNNASADSKKDGLFTDVLVLARDPFHTLFDGHEHPGWFG